MELRINLPSCHYPRFSRKRHPEFTVKLRPEHGIDIAAYVQGNLHTENKLIKGQVQGKVAGGRRA
ncbi:hypothetical protein F4802DRAFT_574606 [Xylaria palmicola]|nr:hypothetical protein F4802DRAFT_574606 [Xylaria palmicola]